MSMMASNERQYVVQGRLDSEAERLSYMIANMSANRAYRHAVKKAGNDFDERILSEFRDRFRRYRSAWRGNPRHAFEHKLHHETLLRSGFLPLCLDVEVAAICDLACPFCFRQWIATPDGLMREELYYRIIDQCAKLGVPSIKLNWRGESLLHPKLPQFVDYAKKSGILETIINTNAVTLDETKSRQLIEAGLDLMIYSFDGGTKATYEKMRVGRFQDNRFETVYENIRRFARIRREKAAVFPRTKIQMILTESTYKEQESFFSLFSDCVDDVSVKAYTERGGKLYDLDDKTKQGLGDFLNQHNLSETAAYWRDLNGTLYIASGRVPCEQPYQRLMVTYDGQVSMCCYDWGVEYPIGYVDEEAYKNGDKQYEIVIKKAHAGTRGFELLKNIRMPQRCISPQKSVQNLRDIWYSALLNDVRKKHIEGHLEEVPICRRCPFKETYRWVKVQLPNEFAAS